MYFAAMFYQNMIISRARDGSWAKDDSDKYAPVAEVVAEAVVKVLAKGLPLCVKGYIRKALRPNIYIGVHYDDIYEEYGPLGLLNVLAEEKYYK